MMPTDCGPDVGGGGKKSAPPQPRYRMIRKALRDRILRGEYRVNDRLPSESELMEAYDVSRVTVRQALQQLRKERLITSRRGKGYFVARPKAVQDLGRLQGLGESIAESGLVSYSRVLDIRETPADRRVAEALALAPETTVMRLRRLRCINHQPVSYDVSFFPVDVGRRLQRHDLVHNDVFVLLEESLEITLGLADLKIEVGAADEALAARLGMEPGAPVLRIERLTTDVSGRPIDFEYLYGRGDAYQFRIRAPRW